MIHGQWLVAYKFFIDEAPYHRIRNLLDTTGHSWGLTPCHFHGGLVGYVDTIKPADRWSESSYPLSGNLAGLDEVGKQKLGCSNAVSLSIMNHQQRPST